MRKVILLITITVFLNIFCFVQAQKSAVTYDFSGGKFGDNLLSYCRAKWIAYKYNIPLLYRPFYYSDQLMMHELDIPLSLENLNSNFKGMVRVGKDPIIDPEANILYVVPFFPESVADRNNQRFPFCFAVDWEDTLFKRELQKTIFPRKQMAMPFPNPANDHIKVAVHIRKGTNFDEDASLLEIYRLKFVADSYYIEQLKTIAQLYPNQQIYVCLFTDHTNPQELSAAYSAAVACDRMTFVCRDSGGPDVNVLEDFFALIACDCLIRTDSNFSIVASKLGDYQVHTSPACNRIINGYNMVDAVHIVDRRYSKLHS
jgi:hypothetical protein